MTDARLPSRWLADRRFLRLPAEHYVSYTFALMYAVESQTDGVLDFEDLEVIPRYKSESTATLVQAGLFKATDDGRLVIVDYSITQTTAAEIRAGEERRLRAREKKRHQRARAPAGEPSSSPPDHPEQVDPHWETVPIPNPDTDTES